MTMDMRDAFFERVVQIAKSDQRVIFLSADHGAFALKEFESLMPDRYINVGISEQNMIGVAAGLAASGKIVFAYGISPFVSLRVMEQLTLDVAAMRLPVNVVSVGAGFTYSTDGPTHHGLQDLPAVLTIPDLNILNSSDPVNSRAFVDYAVASERPNYIRIEKGEFPVLKLDHAFDVERGFSIASTGGGILLISTGSIIHEIVVALPEIERRTGEKVTLIDLFAPSVATNELTKQYIRNSTAVYVIEESYSTGISSVIALSIARNGINVPLRVIAPKTMYYFASGDRALLKREGGLDSAKFADLFMQC
jgi:transketolase